MATSLFNKKINPKKQYDTVYQPRDSDTILFGKFKGHPHSKLKDEPKYVQWLLTTEPEFAQSTKWYVANSI